VGLNLGALLRKIAFAVLLGIASVAMGSRFHLTGYHGSYNEVNESNQGVSFSGHKKGGGNVNAENYGGDLWHAISGASGNGTNDGNGIRCDFSERVQTVRFICSDGGNSDDDGDFTYSAYDSDGFCVDSKTYHVGEDSSDFEVELNGHDIAYVETHSDHGSTWCGDWNVGPASVPEPFTMALMGGAAVVGYGRVRRRRA